MRLSPINKFTLQEHKQTKLLKPTFESQSFQFLPFFPGNSLLLWHICSTVLLSLEASAHLNTLRTCFSSRYGCIQNTWMVLRQNIIMFIFPVFSCCIMRVISHPDWIWIEPAQFLNFVITKLKFFSILSMCYY